MEKKLWTDVDQYIAERLMLSDSALEAALTDSQAAGLPAIAVSAAQGKQLMLLARLMHASKILEIGTLGGYSTIWLARGLSPGGRLVTLEFSPQHAEVARGNIARAGYSEAVEVRVGDARTTIEQLAAENIGPFDLFFIDADKRSIPHYLEWALKMAHRGSLIIVDNVIRDGALIDAKSEDPNVLGVRQMHEMLAVEPRLSATTIQTGRQQGVRWLHHGVDGGRLSERGDLRGKARFCDISNRDGGGRMERRGQGGDHILR